MPGIFVSEGMRLRITDFSITVDQEGELSSSMKFQVALDTWPMWLDVGMDHALEALRVRSRLKSEIESAPGNRLEGELQGSLLTSEAKAGMVAIAAGAFALDNFADIVRDFAPNIDSVEQEWRDADTPRHKRVSETLRRTFKASNAGAKSLRHSIAEIFKFRNWAVHPPGSFTEPLTHDLLDSAVEWRFVAFRARNAANVLGAATSIIAGCINAPRTENHELVQWCDVVRKRSEPRLEQANSQLTEASS